MEAQLQKSHEQNALETMKSGREALDCVFWVFNHGHFQGTAEFLTNMNKAITYLNSLVAAMDNHIQLIEERSTDVEKGLVKIGKSGATVQGVSGGKGKRRRVQSPDLSSKSKRHKPGAEV
jgi:hypothetical protein